MFVPGQNQLLANLSLLLFLRIFRSFVFMILKRTFEECVSLFSYQRSFFALPFVSNSFAIISCCFLLVKKFFQLFSKLFLTFRLISANFDSLSQLTLYCQELFWSFLNLFLWNGEGGIWTLAPLLTTYSLSRGAPSASLGTSPNCPRFAVSQKRLSSHSRVFI